MPVNNEDFSGMFFVKDNNGNLVPVGKTVDFDTVHAVCSLNPPGDIMTTGEVSFSLSDESEAKLWAISQGGIEIVER